jgi:hypothetical protein
MLDAGELDVLLGPIALYPDPLLAILLPAAMEPADIVLAVRFWDAGGDPALVERQRWDENVKGLGFYPEVLRWLDENLEWTRAVGEAFLLQPEDVMAAIQRLRRYAHELGNLVSTTQQIVEADAEWIDILPADADVVYAPVYPRHSVYTQRPAVGTSYVSFRAGARVGPWLRNDWDWRQRRLVGWSRDNFRPRTWWCQSRAQRFAEHTPVREWCPRARGGQFASKWWTQRNAICQAAARGGGGLKAVGSSGGLTVGAGASAASVK